MRGLRRLGYDPCGLQVRLFPERATPLAATPCGGYASCGHALSGMRQVRPTRAECKILVKPGLVELNDAENAKRWKAYAEANKKCNIMPPVGSSFKDAKP